MCGCSDSLYVLWVWYGSEGASKFRSNERSGVLDASESQPKSYLHYWSVHWWEYLHEYFQNRKYCKYQGLGCAGICSIPIICSIPGRPAVGSLTFKHQQGAPRQMAEEQPEPTWCLAVQPAPPTANLLRSLAAPLGAIAGNPTGVQKMFEGFLDRGDMLEPIVTVEDLRTKIEWGQLLAESRGVVSSATLKTLGKLLEPGGG
jgi:hypothetical protein